MGLITRIKELLIDKEPDVMINSIIAISEMLQNEEGLNLSRNQIIYMINKLTGN